MIGISEMKRPVCSALPQRIHIIGIGGSGMSAIARVLALRGYRVSGSDLCASSLTEGLNRLGIATYVGHRAEQVAGVELVAISSAIPESNAEVQAARSALIPVMKRRELLAAMTAESVTVAVAGSHGKTTTAAMTAAMLQRLGLSPSYIVGGVIAELGTNAGAGEGPHFVIEADEYDRAFHGIYPTLAVVTNIEMDHPDYFRDLDDLRAAYGGFLDNVEPHGAIIAGVDSPELARLLSGREERARQVMTYGYSPQAEYRLEGVQANAQGGVDFRLVRRGELWGDFSLGVPGVHNALNATAALIVAECLGLGRKPAGAALASYRGALRRFEVKGERRGVTVVDDYAHHPTQVRATLSAARARYPGRRLWALFQPHTYSRTRALLAELSTCFADADRVLITEVYAARSHERPTISSTEVVAAIQHPCVRRVQSLDEAVDYLLGQLGEGDVLLTLGAGDDYLVGERVLEGL